MEKEITIHIDGVEVKAEEGEYVIDVARRNDIFIPAICYLTRCSPTLACRLCIIDANEKRAYACNAKAKDGMQVVTQSEELNIERKKIMEIYDVNHPLECGVCDQSGECELQNYTLEYEVNSQSQAIKDTHKVATNFSEFIHYDPALCIVCERCVTVCKDLIGDSALKTIKRGAEELDSKYKEELPKDAHAMWNKMNKSLIGISSGNKQLDCSDCGECISVCPVGALVPREFQYTSNAWELKSIPASCTHCSSGCHIYYEVKQSFIDDPTPKIYRVKNEFHYNSLCGAGRFGFDFENKIETKNIDVFNKAINAFKMVDTIIFSSYITNEEAYILQTLKKRLGYKLINNDALKY